MSTALERFSTLARGDVIEVRCGKEIRIFTVASSPHSGGTLVDAVDTDGKSAGIYFRDLIGIIGRKAKATA